MAIAAGFEHDLFVSYAHHDDIETNGPEGWVTKFVRYLEAALRQRICASGALNVFFDSRATGANNQLPDLLNAARTSALFLAVGSPSYAGRDWPQQELEAFLARTPDLSRLFLIECLPLSEGERYPPPLDEHVRLVFWQRCGRRQIPMSLSPVSDAQEFSTLVHSLASDIRDRLLYVRHAAGAPRRDFSSPPADLTRPAIAPQAARPPAGPKKTILLAQTTDDLQEEADQFLRFLNQFEDEVTVLPRGAYPQGGEAFAAAFARDSAQADLFVQLLSRRIGRMPPDLPLGYTRFQLDAARAGAVEIMQWRHPDTDLGDISDPVLQNILTAETVVASGLESFKGQILNWARKRQREPRKAPTKSEAPTVFINADLKDIEVAKEIERECLRHALTTFLPMCGPSSEASRRDLEENLTDCDVLLFIYGDTTQDWIRSQLRFFGKVKRRREADPKLLAICSGPPPQKPDIGVTVPNAHLINCANGWDMASFGSLLAELGQ